MRVLLDTHALIWALEGGGSLSAAARAVVVDTDNDVLVSAASAWEISIKRALGKLDVPDNLTSAIESAGFLRRPIGFAECARLLTLPQHHRDPFDRILIAQALEDGIPIVTCDEQFSRYPIQVIW